MPKRSLQPLLLTLALCALPWIATSHPQGWLVSNAAFAGFIKPLPFLIFAVLAFLGVKLNQSRLLYVSIFLTVAYLYLQVPNPPAFVAFRPWSRIQAVGLCAPISLALIFMLPEGRLLSRRSFASFAAAVGPLVFIAAGLLHRWPWLEHWGYRSSCTRPSLAR